MSDCVRGALVDCVTNDRFDSRVSKRQRIKALLKVRPSPHQVNI